MITTIKTIDINGKEWFDKVNGNSYFSAIITINYGLPDAEIFKLPFQYGYGEHYIDMANTYLIENGIIPGKRHENGSYPSLWQYCRDNEIILRKTMKENCLKKEVVAFGA